MGGSRRTLLSILGLLLTALPLTAQSWPQSKGMSYLKLSYGSSTARDQFTFDGRQKEYADNVDDKTEYLVADGVVAGSALVGLGSALVCWQRRELRRDEQARRGPPPVHESIPDSMRLDPAPADPEVRDATLEEQGLVPAKHPPPPNP